MATVTLRASEFWHLRACLSEQARTQAQAALALSQARQQVAKAEASLAAYQEMLAITYPALMAGNGQYTFDDDAFTVTVPSESRKP